MTVVLPFGSNYDYGVSPYYKDDGTAVPAPAPRHEYALCRIWPLPFEINTFTLSTTDATTIPAVALELTRYAMYPISDSTRHEYALCRVWPLPVGDMYA